MEAVCLIEGNGVKCSVIFIELENGNTRIYAKASGLPPGKHGFHIHEFGDMSNGCDSMGAHWNPYKKEHGCPGMQNRHAGDLGNLIANNKGYAILQLDDNLIKLRGKYSVLGRGMVIHKNEDDCGKGNFDDSKTTGHSGPRLACGIICYRKQ